MDDGHDLEKKIKIIKPADPLQESPLTPRLINNPKLLQSLLIEDGSNT